MVNVITPTCLKSNGTYGNVLFAFPLMGSTKTYNTSYFRDVKKAGDQKPVCHAQLDGSVVLSGDYSTRNGTAVSKQVVSSDYTFTSNTDPCTTYFQRVIRIGVISYGVTGSIYYSSYYEGLGKPCWRLMTAGQSVAYGRCIRYQGGIPVFERYGTPIPERNRWFETEQDIEDYLQNFLASLTFRPSGEYVLGAADLYCHNVRAWEPPNPSKLFMFDEPHWAFLPCGGGGDQVALGMSRATWNAFQSIVPLSANNIAPILEVIQFLISVKKGTFKVKDVLPGSIGDAWLQYRYQYQTTKSDFEQALEFAAQRVHWDMHIYHKAHGYARIGNYHFRVTIRYVPKVLSELRALWSKLYEMGLQPNMSVVWDMLPFSFIVDWGLPIGDLCEIVSHTNYVMDTFDITSYCYSLSYYPDIDYVNGHLTGKCYTRWVRSHPPSMEIAMMYEDHDVSDKTILYRVFDGAALILGRK